jgi:hypothetical protein
MGKNNDIGSIRTRGERDLTISDGALRLLMRICSARYVDPKARMDEPFPLPWSKVALWCGVNGENNCRARLHDLVTAGYLKCDGARGCPPTNFFFLVPKASENGGIKASENGGIKASENGGINSAKNGSHLISNSFQEEKIKGKREELGTSCKGGKPLGKDLAAAPQGGQLSPEDCRKLLAKAKASLKSEYGFN